MRLTEDAVDPLTDPYAATASAFDLLSRPYRASVERALSGFVPWIRPEHGPVLDIGAGSGANAAFVLERDPEARMLALEPSASMRSLLLGRVAAHTEWDDRITVLPDGFFDATLPEKLGGALALGVLGHFDPGERAAVLAELAARLPEAGIALVDLQEPSEPTRVEAHEFATATIGEITYRGIAEAWPIDAEAMRWRMSYLSLDGDRVLTETTTEHIYHHPSPEQFEREAREAGFAVVPLTGTAFRILERQ